MKHSDILSSGLPERTSGPKSTLPTVTVALILIVAFYYIIQYAIRYFGLDPAFYQHHWGHVAWLVLHVAGGMIALLVGPFQFLTTLRRRSIALHRWLGRIYLCSISVSAMAAVYILLIPESSFGFRAGMAGLAFAWICTSSLAYIAIRRGNIAQHKEWMIRSYVVTFGFVLFRLLLNAFNALEISSVEERVSVVSWMCWALPLFLTELVLQGIKIFHSPNSSYRTLATNKPAHSSSTAAGF